jgi:hypothetical protein
MLEGERDVNESERYLSLCAGVSLFVCMMCVHMYACI